MADVKPVITKTR